MKMAEREKAQRERVARALLACEEVRAVIGEAQYATVRRIYRGSWHIEYAPDSIVVLARNRDGFSPYVLATVLQGKWKWMSEAV
jgi:hypothetical protein